MKKLLTLIALLLIAAIGMAQGSGSPKKDKDLDALIADAIKRGRSQNVSYYIYNSKNKPVDVTTATNYLRAKGYTVISSSTKKIVRFGTEMVIFNTLEFREKEEALDSNTRHLIVFNRLKGNSNIQFSQLNKIGKFFFVSRFPGDAEKIGKHIGSKLYLSENVMWSGAIVDGLLEGHGVGFVETEDGSNYFECDFKGGIPVSIYGVYCVKTLIRKTGNITETQFRTDKRIVADVCSNWSQNKYQESSEIHKVLIKYAEFYYAEDARQIELDFNNMLELNRNIKCNYTSTLADDFIKLYGTLNMDPMNMVPKAREIHDVQYVRRIENDIWDMRNYIDYNSYTEEHSFDWDEARADTLALWNAIQFARRKLYVGAENPFKDYWQAMLVNLENKRWRLLDNINEQRQRISGIRQEENEYRSAMCDNCKIDGNKSTVPTGFVEGSWFFGIPTQSENKGIIVMHNGKTVRWWFEWYEVYGSKRKEVRVESDWLGFDSFDTEKEMMNEIIRVCRGKYCN